ncbi:MAG: hypothetical protein IKL52_04335 [Candidatus Gastranaerophilales bacterium]|nr:hypothetical protein [Candidatus Gastranaerophilales bacterium]
MTKVSPLLQSRLNATNTTKNTGVQQAPNNRHEKIYQDLQKKAHEAKPNEAKAKMVKEGILGNPITDVKDTFKDGRNFFKAVHKGNLGDNNLGRINDLGLKIGAGIIASFLALHSKTKTESIMRFIGGATFIAAMELWPKLFINLPARLVHGFRIDRKYISAQGDKKDFFLDNQFLVWDAYPEEQLRKDAKKAGIDYDAKNGKEKIQRKMQKTALQNRTLWMATAGFATPLMTAMFGNFIEPKVKGAVVKHGFNKVNNIVENGMDTYLENVGSKDMSAISTLFKQYEKSPLDDKFFTSLEKLMSPEGFIDMFKDSDDAKAVAKFDTWHLKETLEDIYSQSATVKTGELIERLPAPAAPLFKKAGGAKASVLAGSDAAKQAGEELAKLGNTCTIKQAREIFAKYCLNFDEIAKKVTSDGKKIQIDESKFKTFIETYSKNILAKIQPKTKATLDLMNPIVGSTAESVYTSEFEKTMSRFFKAMNVKTADLTALRKQDGSDTIETLASIIQKGLKEGDGVIGDEKYTQLLKQISPKGTSEKEAQFLKQLEGVLEKLKAGVSFDKLFSSTESIEGIDTKALNEAIVGAGSGKQGLIDLIQGFIDEQKVNIDTIKFKPAICANFERRVLQGEFKDYSAEQLKAMRKMVYDGTISTVLTKGDVGRSGAWDDLVKVLFDEAKVSDIEETAIPGFKEKVKALKSLYQKGNVKGYKPAQNYLACGSMEKLVKDFATRLGNNKAWMKIFAPMAIALVAITLLVQPFFGNIKKEFPDEKNGGTK